MSQLAPCDCAYCVRRRTPIDRTDDRLINEPEAQRFLGCVSHMWIRRRMAEPQFRFPPPHRLGRRIFFWVCDLAAWVESPHATMMTAPYFKAKREEAVAEA